LWRRGKTTPSKLHNPIRSPIVRPRCEIRLCAERKAGELLRHMDRAEKGRPEKTSERTTLSDLGITRDQSSRWQQLAAVLDSLLDRH
jgi:hypothetical protein